MDPRTRLHTPMATNTGPLATAAWCLARGLFPKDRNWFVEIELRADTTRFTIEIYDAEWGFAVHHGDRTSWIRVTDIPFIHGRDDLGLLRETSSLKNIGQVIRAVEALTSTTLPRDTSAVRTNIADADPAIRSWVATL